MKQAGAYTMAKDEESSIVFGMPWEAIKLDAVQDVLPLPGIAGEVLRKCRGHSDSTGENMDMREATR